MGSTDAVARPLTEAALRYLGEKGEERAYGDGDVIVHRGEQGRALYVLLEGRAEVRMPSADGRSLPVCRLAVGATFGELSLLRGIPTTADVVAVGPVRVLLYPPGELSVALGECAELRDRLLVQLAGHLERTTVEAWDQFLRAEALASLADDDDGDLTWVVASPKMRSVDRELDRLAEQRGPVRIVGPAGVGKLTAAKVLHRRSAGAGGLVAVDCRRLPPDRAVATLFGRGGHGRDAAIRVPGAVDLARDGTLVLRHADWLPAAARDAVAGWLEGGGCETRLVVTSEGQADPVDRLEAAIRLEVRMPPLADRPRDILPLVDRFLAEAAPDRELRVCDETRRALAAKGYHHRNVAQLREIVELAVQCVDGDEIRPEHLFGAVGGAATTVVGADLSRAPGITAIVRGVHLDGLRVLIAAGFVATIAVAFALPASAGARAANGLVWQLWEPATFALFLLAGAVWCTVCPLSTLARGVQRVVGGRRAPDAWLRRWGPWLSIAGLLVILWSARAFDMWRRPAATAALLTALALSAVVLAAVYRREVWCRDLCPLGRLASVLAPAAPLAIAASPAVCGSECSDHPCFKGDGRHPGCTVFHHPVAVAEAHRCKLCLDCLRVCPHGSAALYARPPLAVAWRPVADDTAMLPFAVALAFLAPVLLAAGDGRAVGGRWTLLLLAGAAAAAGALAGRWLQGRLAAAEVAGGGIAAAFAVLGWGPLVVAALEAVPVLADLRIGFASETGGAAPGVELLSVVAVLAVAGAIAAAALIAVRVLLRVGERSPARRPVLALLGAAAVLALVAVL